MDGEWLTVDLRGSTFCPVFLVEETKMQWLYTVKKDSVHNAKKCRSWYHFYFWGTSLQFFRYNTLVSRGKALTHNYSL